MQIPFSFFWGVIMTHSITQEQLKQMGILIVKINKQFGSSKNKVSIDISSSEALRFIEYLEARAMLRRKFSGGDRTKYALYIEIIAFSITITHDKSPHLRAVIAKRSIEMLSELNSGLKVSLGVIIQGL